MENLIDLLPEYLKKRANSQNIGGVFMRKDKSFGYWGANFANEILLKEIYNYLENMENTNLVPELSQELQQRLMEFQPVIIKKEKDFFNYVIQGDSKKIMNSILWSDILHFLNNKFNNSKIDEFTKGLDRITDKHNPETIENNYKKLGTFLEFCELNGYKSVTIDQYSEIINFISEKLKYNK